MSEYPRRCHFEYDRVGNIASVKARGMTNHELRGLLVGLWLTLEREDQEDFILELQHYLDPGSSPSVQSRQIATAIIESRSESFER